MLKTLGFVPRRPDVSRAAFREHYEARHAPLAVRSIRLFAGYVRNHVVSAVPAEPPFDCVSEFWFADGAALRSLAGWLASPAAAELHEDEERFMDRARVVGCAVREERLLGPPRACEPGPVRRLGLLLRRDPAHPKAAFEDAVRALCADWIARHARHLRRVCLDLPLDPTPPGLPLHALVSAWPDPPGAALAPPRAGGAIAALTAVDLDSFETPPAALRG